MHKKSLQKMEAYLRKTEKDSKYILLAWEKMLVFI